MALPASAQFPSAADEMSTILGPCAGDACTPASGSGNNFTLTQQGQRNSASAEQQAIGGGYGNLATLSQNGIGNVIGLTQTNGQNAVGIAQTGDHNSVTLNQPGGVSASVTQTGNSSRPEPDPGAEYFHRRYSIWKRRWLGAGHDYYCQIGKRGGSAESMAAKERQRQI